MTMQRRHFELIATTIRELRVSDEVRAHTAHIFATNLRGTNPNFDAERFKDACKPLTTYKNRSK